VAFFLPFITSTNITNLARVIKTYSVVSTWWNRNKYC